MTKDIFGNLRDRALVVMKINVLCARNKLDDYQDGLIRILRYRKNWLMREDILKHIKDVHNPSDLLLQEVLAILMDEDLYHDTRILAAEALACVFSRKGGTATPEMAVNVPFVLKNMDDLLRKPLLKQQSLSMQVKQKRRYQRSTEKTKSTLGLQKRLRQEKKKR
jgi:hypothetical protein